MKNKLVSLGLMACFSVATLASCSNYKDFLKKGEDQVILTVDGEKLTEEDLMKQFSTTNSTGIEAYYNAISEVLVRNAMKSYEQSAECQTYVNAKIENFKEDAKEKADKNSTSYKEELNAALSSAGVDDLDAYKDKITYEKLQEELQDQYYESNKDAMKKEYVDTVLPYHIRHVLVKVGAASSDLVNANISEDNAAKLASTVRRLANVNKDGTAKPTQETFGDVAFAISDDDGSKAKYGDLGIMSTKTSFVNEFKLGIYAYEALLSPVASTRKDFLKDNSLDSTNAKEDLKELKKNRFAIPTEYQSKLVARSYTIVDKNEDGTALNIVRRENGIGYIPFKYTQSLDEYKSMTKDDNGKLVNEGDENYYPRNIIYSTFFNDHGINLIINDTNVGNFKKEVTVGGVTKYALCADGDVNKPILVTRAGSSYEGIHFMVVEKSPLKETQDELVKYYDDRTKAELTADNATDLIGKTYVTYLNSTSSNEMDSRSSTVEQEIKGFDTMLDSKIFYKYLNDETSKVKIIDEDLKAQIDRYIDASQLSNFSSEISSNEEAWKSYFQLLQLQDAEVEEDRIKLYAAFGFHTNWDKGDERYHGK